MIMVLHSQEEKNSDNKMSAKPRDGPATSFYADPMVASIYQGESDYFDLVLPAGGPLLLEPEDLKSYADFVTLVQSCLDPEDLQGDQPTAYFYQPDYLHVTIATLYPIERQKASVDYDGIKEHFKRLLQAASQRPEWPQEPLELQIGSAQLGSKAGIILWREVTGGMANIRQCLVATEKEQSDDNTPWKIHSIPGIIHTSFLRFASEPTTNGGTLQEQFQQKVLPAIHGIFPRKVLVSKVHLVCETTPYMRVPMDDQHVVWATDLSASKDSNKVIPPNP